MVLVVVYVTVKVVPDDVKVEQLMVVSTVAVSVTVTSRSGVVVVVQGGAVVVLSDAVSLLPHVTQVLLLSTLEVDSVEVSSAVVVVVLGWWCIQRGSRMMMEEAGLTVTEFKAATDPRARKMDQCMMMSEWRGET